MSDDQLDDGFRDRVKEVFENYEDDSADEGWLLLREKYPAREQHDRAIFWWRFAGVAACLVLLLFFYPAGRNKVVRRLTRTSGNSVKQIVAQQPMVSHAKAGSHAPIIQAAKQIVAQQPMASHIKAGSHAHISQQVQQQPQYVVSQSTPVPAKTNPQVVLNNPPVVNNPSAAVIIKNNQALLPKDSNATIYQSPVTALNNKTADTSHKKPEVTVSKSMLALFDKDVQTGNNKIVQKQAANNVVFGVYTASYVNYAKGSKAQFNNGGGLSVDIRISDRLSINTGILVAQNSLAYSGSTSGYPAPAEAFYSTNFPGLSNLAPSSSNQAVSLVNLDVPVNLTYQFNPQKGNTYFSAGLSSGTFINESYVTTYNYNVSQNNPEQLSQDDHHKSFDDFYFGQMLNLAFGVGYPLGKNKLVIEPFFKYPLGGLGDQHILFGSGGLNLKFNFGPSGIRK